MERSFSLWLDLTRFLMAVLVVFYHSAFPHFLPWLPWVNVGHHAVIVFFVLSGMVMALITESKESTFSAYAVGRFVRIYSVLLPALVISVPTFFLGATIAPEIYAHYYVPVQASELVMAVGGNLLLLNQHGWFPVGDFANTPIWSLCYEFWYYILFAAFTFPPSKTLRYVLCALLCVAVGPRILILFPIWILGVIVYRSWLRLSISEACGWLLFLAPIVLYLVGYFLHWPQAVHEMSKEVLGEDISEFGFSQHFVFDYVFGLGVASHFVGANRVAFRFAALLNKFERPIRFLASYTFSLYLLHYPLLQFYAATLGHDPDNILDGLLLWMVTFVTIFLVGSVTERRRHVLKQIVMRIVNVRNERAIRVGRES